MWTEEDDESYTLPDPEVSLVYSLHYGQQLKLVRTPLAIIGSLGMCIYGPASRHWLISYSPIHLT